MPLFAPSSVQSPPFGLPETTLSNNTSDATNDIDFSAGLVVVSDGTNRIPISFPALTKQLDAAWASGNNAGGLDTGSKANSTWYYAWAIYNPSTATADFLFSASATTPTLPSGYTYKRRVGSIQTQSGGAIRPFTQFDDSVIWTTVVIDLSSVSVPTTDTLYTFTIPPNLSVELKGILNPGYANDNSYLTVAMKSPSQSTAPLEHGLLLESFRGEAGSREGVTWAAITHAHSPGWFTNTGQFKLKRLGTYYPGISLTSFQTLGFRDLAILRGA
jgi:hypothetical protein